MLRLTFTTKADATKYLHNTGWLVEHTNGFSPKGTYYLSHGEYSQPDFKPVRYKDGWGIKKIHYFYNNTLNAPKDGRVVAFEDNLVLESALGKC